MKVKERNRLAAAARMIALEAKERLWELEMDQRIITESALIRAEWCEEVRAARWVMKTKPLEIKTHNYSPGRPHGGTFE
jgi:hypothetical protein